MKKSKQAEKGSLGSTLRLLSPLLRVVRAQETASSIGTPIALPDQACVDFMGPYLRQTKLAAGLQKGPREG